MSSVQPGDDVGDPVDTEVPAITTKTVFFSHREVVHVAETSGIAVHSPDDSAQEDAIRALTATADQRQKTFQDIRETSMLESVVRDDRRCDYPLQPVPRVASARRSVGSRRGSRVASAPHEDTKQANGAQESIQVEGDGLMWRCHLQAHVAQLLMELRNRPQDLHVFLAAHYPKGDTNDDSSDDEDDVQEVETQGGDATKKRPSVYEISPAQLQRHVRKCLSVQDVYKRLTEIGIQLGERLYHRLRAMLLKSVANGVIDRASNVIRLESMFKLEMRRHVTINAMRDEVSTKQADHHKRRQKQRLARTKKRSSATKDGLEAHSPTKSDDPHQDEVNATEEASSAHHFKMLALERVIAAERKQGATSVGFSQRVVTEQLEEQLHERITAMLYNKNRDSFPFWKDPPENALSRDETAKVLRVVVGALLVLPVFRTLSIDQLLEVAKASRWKTVAQGHIVSVKNDVIDQLIIVMDGRVTPESSLGDTSRNHQAVLQRVASRMDDRRSVDSQQEAMKESFGELGLLTKNETWGTTLRVATTQAKLLVLSRDSFDAVLTKMFGGFKRQLTHSMKRPTSSPAAARISSRLQPGGVVSPRPLTAAKAREEAVSKFRAFRDDQLARSIESEREVDGAAAQEPEQSDAGVAVTPKYSGRKHQSGQLPTSLSVYQHYPSFTSSNSGSAASHLFRLKCIQPIAFGMKPMEDLIHEEWAPAFPDTCTLVDFLATTDTNLLFDKRNVLLKANLRAVCTNIPFQEARPRADENSGDIHGDTVAHESSTLSTEAAASLSLATQAAGGGVAMIPVNESDSMTLGQFAEARKRIFGRHGASFGGGQSPSMRNLLASSATSATLAKNGNAPFTNSSFVPEASFTDDPKSKHLTEVGDDDDEQDEEEEIFEVPETPAQGRKSSTLFRPQRPEVDEDESDDSDDEDEKSALAIDVAPTPTQARKSALDSLIQTISSPTRKKSMIDQEAARRIILQKHLQAAKQESTSGRRKSSMMGADAAANTTNPSNASNAPLPLRVDLQRRMEVVLAALKMKPKTKLDLVLKYTHADFYELFPDAVVLWEQALHYIQKREKALDALRQFELVASDPRRHFRSLSTHRLTEQKERDALFYQLNYASDLCRESLDELETRCNDIVYLEARLYRDKMKKDYTELLFDVEQERLRMIYKNVHPSTKPQAVDALPNNGRGPIAPSQAPVTVNSARYALATPRENIYVSVLERERQDERQERERSQLQEQALQQQKRHQGLSAQVKQHRQAQLDAMRNDKPTPPTPNQGTPRPKARTSGENTDQVRMAAVVENVSSITQVNKMASLKSALERALGGR